MRLRQTRIEQAAPTASQSHGIGLSSDRVTSPAGDDLKRARYFSLKAGLEMAAIIDADRTESLVGATPKGRDAVWLCERLGIIQSEAKRARARAVYRSAQDALGLIQRRNAHMPIDWTRVDGRLFVLNKLLGQYEAGLQELEVPADDAVAGRSRPSNDLHGSAKDTLNALLPHASAEERTALSRLMDLDLTPVQRPPLAPPFPETAPPFPKNTAKRSVDRIEWIMPDLVQRLLELGREYGKVFSVSHSLDDVMIDAGSSHTVHTRLYDRLSDLIASNLPIQGVGRLDICAKDDALLISGSGFDDFSFDLPERIEDPIDDALDTIAAQIDTATTPPRPPMITDETEGELRAQLAVLMDVGLADFGKTK